MANIYPSLFSLLYELKMMRPDGIPMHTPSNFEVMELGKHGEGRLAASPMPMCPLFRGQSLDYGSCKPSLHRREWTDVEKVEREMQLYDFKEIINTHPEIQQRIKAGNEVNYMALAQHYGIATNMLDLTNSPLVASFFATTEYDATTNTYRPVLNRITKGVLYYCMDGGMFNMTDDNRIWPVGHEALHRPGEQRAFEMTVKEGCDIMDAPCMKKYYFWHNPEESLRIWNCTLAGTVFFPYDPMADKVRNMQLYHYYSLDALKYAYRKYSSIASDVDKAKEVLEGKGFRFFGYVPFAYTANELHYIESELKKIYKDLENK